MRIKEKKPIKTHVQKEIGLHSIVNTCMTHVFKLGMYQQTWTSDNRNRIGGGLIFNPVYVDTSLWIC